MATGFIAAPTGYYMADNTGNKWVRSQAQAFEWDQDEAEAWLNEPSDPHYKPEIPRHEKGYRFILKT